MGVINHEPQQGLSRQAGLRLNSLSHTNPNLTIEFFIPQSEKVTIGVYNLSGHEISALVNKNLVSGAHSIIWNTRDLAAGCYMVKMQAGSNTYVKSIPVLR
jgi:hypothetical protein